MSVSAGYLFGFVDNLTKVSDNNWIVPKENVFHLGVQYEIIAHMNCNFPRDEADLGYLDTEKIKSILEKTLTDKGVVTDVCVVVIITEIQEPITTGSKSIELNMKLHSNISKLATKEELVTGLTEYLKPTLYQLSSPAKGYLESNGPIMLIDDHKIPQGTHFTYYTEGNNDQYPLTSIDGNYELHYDGMMQMWSNSVPIKLQETSVESQLRVLTVIITYYFDVHTTDDINKPPLSAESITKFLALELQSEDYHMISVHVLPPIAKSTSYTVRIDSPGSQPHHINTPEALIGVHVSTQNTNNIIPEVHSKLQKHFTVSHNYQLVNLRVLPQVPEATSSKVFKKF